jgi:hypothetical protein
MDRKPKVKMSKLTQRLGIDVTNFPLPPPPPPPPPPPKKLQTKKRKGSETISPSPTLTKKATKKATKVEKVEKEEQDLVNFLNDFFS